MYDVAVVGGGVLGTCVSYWASALCGASVCVVEKEPGVAAHASGRNTGVVHTPFYMDPGAGGMASAALESRPMWEGLARRHGAPWRETGLLELALDEGQHRELERHARWAAGHGVPEGGAVLVDAGRAREVEPGVSCHSAIHCPREAATDYAALTRAVRAESERLGTRFLTGSAAASVRPGAVETAAGPVEARLVVNCAGGSALALAQSAGLAAGYSVLHFRGEYWVADPARAGMARSSLYTVPEFPGYPFLDPHWIRRADGSAEVGPNAVPVPGPETYEGFGGAAEALAKLADVATGSARRLVTSPEFVAMASREVLSSVSKAAMVRRVQRFLPAARPGHFVRRGTAGVRSPVVTPEGRFLAGALELEGDGSLHVVNYNSPGATGAPAYSERLVRRMIGSGLLPRREPRGGAAWPGQG